MDDGLRHRFNYLTRCPLSMASVCYPLFTGRDRFSLSHFRLT